MKIMNNGAKIQACYALLRKLFHVIWDDYPGPKLGPVI